MIQVLVIINNVGMEIHSDANVKYWLTKEYGIIWTSINCGCECNKLCDIGDYLEYENCKCRK